MAHSVFTSSAAGRRRTPSGGGVGGGSLLIAVLLSMSFQYDVLPIVDASELPTLDTFYQSAAADHHVPVFELLTRSRRAAANANTTNTGATLEANNAPTLVITQTAAVTPTRPPADASAQGVAAAVSRLTPLYPAPRPLLGANGTGIRWDVSSSTSSTTTQKPTVVSEPIDSDEATIQRVVDNVDVPSNEDEAEAVAKAHNFTIQHRDFPFYNSSLTIDSVESAATLSRIQNMPKNPLLSQSHRRAITVELTFDFPFYGHPIRNITVATGGFLYTGEYVHSWLAATQYIAPLMANFDSSMSTDSNVRFQDNGTAFTVLWENIPLQDLNITGQFTFSATLLRSGHIIFNYYRIPIDVEKIREDNHPVKIGLSDAYIIDRQIVLARRKTIYEYDRVNFEGHEIDNNTIVRISPNPTCPGLKDCASCTLALNSAFKCYWCPATNKCSTGTDRKRQEWLSSGCDRQPIDSQAKCPAIGTTGNRYGSINNYGNNGNGSAGAATNMGTEQTFHVYQAPNGQQPQQSLQPQRSANNGTTMGAEGSGRHAVDVPQHADRIGVVRPDAEEVSGFVTFVSVFMPIGLVLTLCLWLFYAYRNPHTKSGQLLIQYRPAQWSWRRSEARYTAATIHM